MASFASSVPWAVAIVVAVTGAVLFLTFGSVFLPLKAVLMSLLSITASFGALVCSRDAISNASIRVAISGSPTAPSRRRLRSFTRSNVSRCSPALTPAGFETLRIGSPWLRSRVPV